MLINARLRISLLSSNFYVKDYRFENFTEEFLYEYLKLNVY